MTLIGLIIIDLLTRKYRSVPSDNIKSSSVKNYNHENINFQRFIENLKNEYFFYVHDNKGVFTYLSPSVENILGYSQKEFRAHYTKYLTDNPINEEARKKTELNLSGKIDGATYEIEVYHRNRSRRLLEVTEFPIKDSQGNILGIEGIAHDVTEHKKKDDDIHRLSQAIDQCSFSIVITDMEGNIEYANNYYRKINNCVGKPLEREKPRVLKWGNMSNEQNKELWETIIKGKEWRGEFENKNSEGKPIWENVTISPIKNKNDKITHFLILEEDVTLQKEYAIQLDKKASYDELTGLPNRATAMDRLNSAIKVAERENHAVAVMYIDIDQFKMVNDSLGHVYGDQLITETSKRLIASVRKSDTVARIGGDEFLIILPVLEAVTQLSVVAQKVLASFTEPFILNNHEIHATASIGVTTYPSDGNTPDDLLRNADSAMFKAKETARNTFCFYTNEMNEQAVSRIKMEYQLRHAIERNEFYLEYQPLIDIRTFKPVAVEALLRWKNSELGIIPPNQFIPLAEQTGLINSIGKWVLGTACEQARSWNKNLNFLMPIIIAVNVSSRQIKEGNLINVVQEALKSSSLSPELLELEITENLLLEDDSQTLSILRQLNRMGVRLSIDDFGTGYSSLSYLKKFPISTLKIDSSFVRDITHDEGDVALTKAIIAMAHSLGLTVIGEGVETKEQLDFLKKEGCDIAQGYYFSRPLTSKGLKEYLNNYINVNPLL